MHCDCSFSIFQTEVIIPLMESSIWQSIDIFILRT